MSMLPTPKDESGPNSHIVEVQEPNINKDILKKVNEALKKSPIEPPIEQINGSGPNRHIVEVPEPHINRNYIFKLIDKALNEHPMDPINPPMAAPGVEMGWRDNSDLRALEGTWRETLVRIGKGLSAEQLLQLLRIDPCDGFVVIVAILEGRCGTTSQKTLNVDEFDHADIKRVIAGLRSLRPPPVDQVIETDPSSAPREAANGQNQLLQVVQMGQDPLLEPVRMGHELFLKVGQVDPAVDQLATTSDAKDTGKNQDIEVDNKENEEGPVKELEAKRGKPYDQMDLD